MRSLQSRWCLVVMLIPCACGKQSAPAQDQAVVTTDGQLQWSPGGDARSVAIDGCQSGARRDFFGVILTSSDDPKLEILIRRDVISEQHELRIHRVGGAPSEALVLSSSGDGCDTFEAEIDNTGGYTDSYLRIRKGRLELSCGEASGARVTATATFDGCS